MAQNKEPKCNRPRDHKYYLYAHAANTSTHRLSLFGKECPVHGPTAKRQPARGNDESNYGIWMRTSSTGKDYGPNPYEPPPDAYVSPHSLDYRNEMPVKTVIYQELPTNDPYDPYAVALLATGYRYDYPHADWFKAREAYAADPERHPLDTVLMHVTEDNPPPGPAIPVYKPAAPTEKPPLRSRNVGISVLAWSVTVGFCIPYEARDVSRLTLFIIISVVWLFATWALRRAR